MDDRAQPQPGEGWRRQTNGSFVLQGVSCPASNDCWAVGYDHGGSGGAPSETLTEHYDGSAWTLASSPNQGDSDNLLYGVSCLAGNDCWAVGYDLNATSSINETLTEHYDGNAWTVAGSPDQGTGDNYLNGVSCVSGSDCWAVGYDVNTNSSVNETLTEHYDGSAWTVVASQNRGADNNALYSVSCISSSDCWAVGYDSNVSSSANETLAEHYNGSTWALVGSVNQSASDNVLYGITCVASNDCWAAGYDFNVTSSVNETLTEHYNGGAWTVAASPNQDNSNNQLYGVTCVASNDCWVVGNDFNTTNSIQETLTEHYDGNGWTVVSSSNQGISDNYLYGVTCPSSNDCWAVGYARRGTTNTDALAEHWDGAAWSVAANPILTNNFLRGVTCVATGDCWAVGFDGPYFSSGGNETLIEHYSPSGWSLVTSASPNGTLVSVTCASAIDCWAVGFDNGFKTLTEHYNGTVWSASPSPSPSSTTNSLSSVECVATNDCWAVGNYTVDGSGGLIQTLALHYDGIMWSTVASPNQDTGTNSLDGVTCVSSSDCWAVGFYVDTSAGTHEPLTEHYDGSAWTVFTGSADPTGTLSSLLSVDCVSSTDCWTVGFEQSDSVIEHYDGAGWTFANAPSVNGSQLEGVTCVTSSDCWAVGESLQPISGAQSQTLIEHYDGSVWSTDSSPNWNRAHHNLSDVTCLAGDDCWAVGEHDKAGAHQTLVEHHEPELSANIPELPWVPALAVIGAAAALVRPHHHKRRGISLTM